MPLYEMKEIQERPDIWIIRGDYNIIAKITESIDRCKKELLVVIPPALNSVVDLVIPALTNVKAAGVNIRILMSGEVPERSIAKIASLAELRMKDNMFGGGVIVDATEVILLLGRRLRTEKPSRYGLITLVLLLCKELFRVPLDRSPS